jgi:hypothetical protein
MNLPILIKQGLFDYLGVTENSNSVTKYSNTQNMLLPSKYYRIENFLARVINNLQTSDQKLKFMVGRT